MSKSKQQTQACAPKKRGQDDEFQRTIANSIKAEEQAAADRAASAQHRAGGSSEQTQARILLELARDAKLFHTSTGDAHARVPAGEHYETYPVRERGTPFRSWLTHHYFKTYGAPPSSTAMTGAMEVLESRARFEGEEHEVYTRVAAHDGKVYLDLANDNWEVVEITANGWEIVKNPPVYFRRPRGMLALPTPDRTGSVDTLRRFINVSNDSDWRLIMGWLVGALHPSGPYPVLSLNGERGSAKSNATRFLRRVIDPTEAPTRDAPKEPRDLAVASYNNWVLALENLSSIPIWLSDALCRLSTGGGFATRALYSDDEEAIFYARRPIVFNGIEELATRGDLLDRAIVVTLPPIASSQRKTEHELNAAFDTVHAEILGGLLNAVASAVRDLPNTRLSEHPRMADFATWVTAAEPGLGWRRGAFIAVYQENRENAVSIELDASPLATAIVDFMEKNNYAHWMGYANELYGRLDAIVGHDKPKGWPGGANFLAGALKRIAPSMRSHGYDINQLKRDRGGRPIEIRRVASDDGDDSDDAVTMPAKPSSPRKPASQAA